MLTERARYGLKALVYLVRHQSDGWVQAGEIAEAEGIPQRFLETILLSLRKGGLIVSKAGRHGGHRLGKDPAEVTLLAILRLLDGPVAPLPCLSRTAYRKCADCQDEGRCGSRRLLGSVYRAMIQVMETTTLAAAEVDSLDQDPADWVI